MEMYCLRLSIDLEHHHRQIFVYLSDLDSPRFDLGLAI